MKEGLIVNGQGEYKSRREIQRDLALNGQLPTFFDPFTPRGYDEYLDQADKRAQQMKELSPIHEQVRIELPDISVIHIMSDVHLGNPNTNIQRFRQEIEAIRNTPLHYVLFTGDLVDGMFWGGQSQGEQSLNLSEQHGLLRSLFKALKGKMIAGIGGEHDDKWQRKTGSSPYDYMEEMTGAPYMRGIAEIEIDIHDQSYLLVAQHKGRGHSMYNKNHPTYRESRFDVQGADVYISAHTHQKQIAQEAIRQFGKSNRVTHVSTGTYKTGDEYGDRSGFAHQKSEEMYGASIRLHAERKLVEVEYDILEAVRKW